MENQREKPGQRGGYGVETQAILRNDGGFIMTLRRSDMLNRKKIPLLGLMVCLSLMLGACSTLDGLQADLAQLFKASPPNATQKEIVYVEPMADGSLPPGVGPNAVIAPTSQMDLSYNRIASGMTDSSVELYSLDQPNQTLRAGRGQMMDARQPAAAGDYAMRGVASSTDSSVTIFPFTNDMYTPGVKAGIPGFRSMPRGGGGLEYGSQAAAPYDAAAQIADLPMYVGSPNKIYFDHGSAALSAVARQVLADVARRAPGNRVIVEAHASQRAAVADPVERAKVNMRMSMKRAMAVTKALIAQGVPEHMIKTTALGDTKPAAEEIDRKAEALNRRVEILTRP